MSVPSGVTEHAPLLVIPTVHPRGDRRIVRCAQVALDAGFRVHFIWLGDGMPSDDPVVGETVLPSPKNARERISMVGRVARAAEALDGEMWHIHDYYFLHAAKRWRRRSGKPVLYDVHEYYASYYAEKLPIPRRAQEAVAGMLERYQVRAARMLGGANVVTERMAESFRDGGVPVSVSPNFPMLSQFAELPSIAFQHRRWVVLHVGTLSRTYGTELLVDLARRSAERGLLFEFWVLGRYPSPEHQTDFERVIDAAGRPANLRILPTRPTHEMPELLSRAGFGLSLLMPDGQNEEAVPSKNYEHAMAGLVNVVTERRAQWNFSTSNAVTVHGDSGLADSMLDEMVKLAEAHDETDAALRARARAAKERFTWELAVEPGLRAQLLRLRSVGR
ncbi:glycosyltransferase [Microbacterium sp. TPD7012]|uniref:glycosyltransferase n=1 Tax=Microbacterium sp. TPD7012 TaxID=2171975 RepID=UPI001401F680|nr:glycosyltransferase [Microbacterium sp. TPD7012]